MNGAAVVALVVFAVAAVADWYSRLVGTDEGFARRLEVIAKPLATAALVASAALVDTPDDARRWWFVAALVLSLVGDVALLEDRRFVAGLSAFALAHIAYVIGFLTDGPSAVALIVSAIVTVAAVSAVAVKVVGAVRVSAPDLVAPVAVYIVLIAAMLTSALASGIAVAAVGAALFTASDSMIAWNKFVRPFAYAGVAIMVTYHLGQLGLVLSLL